MISSNESQHGNYVDEILSTLKKSGVTLNLNNLPFFNRKLDYLVHTTLPGKLAAASVPTKAILEAPFPMDKASIRLFLGDGCNVYKRFVPKFTGFARPLS